MKAGDLLNNDVAMWLVVRLSHDYVTMVCLYFFDTSYFPGQILTSDRETILSTWSPWESRKLSI